MDITPLIPKGVNIIQGYGENGFTVSNKAIQNNIIILPQTVLNWNVKDINALEAQDFSDILKYQKNIELLLIGTGQKLIWLNKEIREYFKNHQISIDVMNTGAACRTYNVLISEGRKVAAALYHSD